MGRYLTVASGMTCGLFVLSGCVEGEGLTSPRPDASATAAADRPAATSLANQDIEAPEVFQKSESGLWDGRPSLGGVWVAHPDATDPERVLIRNASNGQTIIGALFRRERNNPGPRFQVSSDAAASLGMIAGAPVELSVTALRREEAPTPEPEPAVEAADAEPVIAAADETDAVAGAAAAIDRAENTEDGADATAALEAEPVDTPRQRRFLGGLFAPRATSDPLTATGAPVQGAEVGSELSDATAVESSALSEPAPVQTQETAAAEARVEAEPAAAEPRRRFLGGLFTPRDATEPLTALATTSAVGATNAVATSSTGVPEAEAISESVLPASAPAAEQAPAPSRQSAALSEPYVEVARFTSEDAAKDASATLRERGIVPMLYEQEVAGESGWRVVVGPASTRSQRSRLIRQVKRLGFDDATPVVQ